MFRVTIDDRVFGDSLNTMKETARRLDEGGFLLCFGIQLKTDEKQFSIVLSISMVPSTTQHRSGDMSRFTIDIPEEMARAIRLGTLTALQKPDGGVRSIVVGDVFRQKVARTKAQQYSKLGEVATHLFQFALSTRAGTECVTHMVQALTSEDRDATILSIDGIGAYDLISRNAMLRGVLGMVDGEKLLPFLRLFDGSPSTFLWEDDTGKVHHVRQGEGGEQGDPLMPLLFSLGMHSALVAVKAKQKEGERLFAFLDDVNVTCTPARVLQVFQLLEAELFQQGAHQCPPGQNPNLEQGWTRTIRSRGTHNSSEKAQTGGSGLAWRPNVALVDQGLIVLGASVGQPEFVKVRLEEKSRQHQKLLERISTCRTFKRCGC